MWLHTHTHLDTMTDTLTGVAVSFVKRYEPPGSGSVSHEGSVNVTRQRSTGAGGCLVL
jgi:hypothetical protein